jgi:hypothetical protein
MTWTKSTASTVQRYMIKRLYKGWEMRPGGYFDVGQLLDLTTKKFGTKIDKDLLTMAVVSLENLGYLEVHKTEQNAIRITPAGMAKYAEDRKAKQTRWIAAAGAVTGTLAFVKDIVEVFFKQ